MGPCLRGDDAAAVLNPAIRVREIKRRNAAEGSAGGPGCPQPSTRHFAQRGALP